MKKQQQKNKKQNKKLPFSGALHDLYRKALKHSKYRWLVVLGTVFYLVNPFDFSPDVIPVLGWIDDGLIVSLLITEMGQLMSEQLTRKRSGFVATPAEADQDLEDIQTITVDAVSV